MAKYMGGECGKNFTFLSQERSSGFSIKGLSIQAHWAIINRKEESRKVYSHPPHLFPYPKFYIIPNKTQLYEIIFLFNFFIPKSVNKKIKFEFVRREYVPKNSIVLKKTLIVMLLLCCKPNNLQLSQPNNCTQVVNELHQGQIIRENLSSISRTHFS